MTLLSSISRDRRPPTLKIIVRPIFITNTSRPFSNYQLTVEAEGFFKPSMPHTVKRVAEIVVLHAIGFYLLFNDRIAAGLCKYRET